MTVKTENQTEETKTLIDDVSDVNMDKLAALKAKMAQKDDMIKIVAKKTRSIKLGAIGSGQCGSNLSSLFYKLGYPAVCFNTAAVDLASIQLPESNKYLFDYGLGGASASLEIGRAACEQYKEAIHELISDKLDDAQVLVFCTSLSGGSGSGSTQPVLDVLSAIGKPIIVIAVLPTTSESGQNKLNTLETLSLLSKELQNKRIHNLIVIDNAKIETIYKDVNPIEFFEVANKAAIEVLDVFNTYSSVPSSVKSLDPTEWSRLLLDSGAFSVYGKITVSNYKEDTAIAEAVINNLNSGLLAGGFDLKQSKHVGVMICARKNVWNEIPNSSVNYAMALIGESCGCEGIFKGIYVIEDMPDNVVEVYSFFNGLAVPSTKIDQLKKESVEATNLAKTKSVERNLNLQITSATDDTLSAADKIRQEISKKKSGFGNLLNATIDKRKK